MTFLRAFLALLALALPAKADGPICAPVGLILDTLADAGSNLGGARLDILEGAEADAFVAAAGDFIPEPADHALFVVSLVPDRYGLQVVVHYISGKSCIVASAGLLFSDWRAIRRGAGLSDVHPAGLGI